MEAERRAAQKAARKRRVITVLVVVVVVLGLMALISVLGGDDDGGDEDAAPETTTTTAPDKPEVTIPEGPAPTTLQSTDITVGEGAEAQTGDTINVRYVGKIYETGEEFESTYEAPEPVPIQLVSPGVIEGWAQGLVGMREGGRRQLVIPPDLGYGAEPSGDIPANSTLVFVIDLISVEASPEPLPPPAPPPPGG
jgi:peptidylprolyl isomerase